MKRTLTALTLAVSIMATGAYAFDNDTLKLLKDLAVAKTVNLVEGQRGTLQERREIRQRLQSAQEDWGSQLKRGVDLSSADLSQMDLADVNLSDADLRNADLAGAIFTDAIFSNADLSGTDLSRANLKGADMSEANLSEANLSGANLSDVNLERAFLNGAVLCNTIMPDHSVVFKDC